VKETVEKIKEWMRKSEKKVEGKTVYFFIDVMDEVENFLMDKILSLSPEKIENLFFLLTLSEDEEVAEMVPFLLRHLFRLNPHLYPFADLWRESKSLITLNVEVMLEDEENSFLIPPFGTLMISSPKDLDRGWKVFVEPPFFNVIKKSFAVEVIFDYLSHLSPSGFDELVFYEDEETEELSMNPKGITKLVRFIGKLWDRENGRKRKIIYPGGKLKKLMPVILKFIRTYKEKIELIAHVEAIFFIENLLSKDKENTEVKFLLDDFGDFISKLELNNKDARPFLEKVLLNGLSDLELNDVIVKFDSDGIYEGLAFLLNEFAGEDYDREGMDALIEFADALSYFPYISRDYNYYWMLTFTVLLFIPFLDMDFQKGRKIIEGIQETPQKAFTEFAETFMSSFAGNSEIISTFGNFILRTLFKSENYEGVLRVYDLLDSSGKEALTSLPESELIITMSEFFAGRRSKEDTLKELEERKEVFEEVLGEELPQLEKLIKGEKLSPEEVFYPVDLLYYYPYAEERYRNMEIEFDYTPKKLKKG